jgi:hypothetical protein
MRKARLVRPARPLAYEVYGHRIVLSGQEGAWRLAVDREQRPGVFDTVADAWVAGVREADRLGPAGRSAPAGR